MPTDPKDNAYSGRRMRYTEDSPDTSVGNESAGWRRFASWGQHVQDRSCMTRGTWDCLGDLPCQDILCPYILCKGPARAGSKLQNTWQIKPFGRSSVRTYCVLIPCARDQHVQDRSCITRGTSDCVEYPPPGHPVSLNPLQGTSTCRIVAA